MISTEQSIEEICSEILAALNIVPIEDESLLLKQQQIKDPSSLSPSSSSFCSNTTTTTGTTSTTMIAQSTKITSSDRMEEEISPSRDCNIDLTLGRDGGSTGSVSSFDYSSSADNSLRYFSSSSSSYSQNSLSHEMEMTTSTISTNTMIHDNFGASFTVPEKNTNNASMRPSLSPSLSSSHCNLNSQTPNINNVLPSTSLSPSLSSQTDKDQTTTETPTKKFRFYERAMEMSWS